LGMSRPFSYKVGGPCPGNSDKLVHTFVSVNDNYYWEILRGY